MSDVLLLACQCYDHSDECVYNEEVAMNKSSIDIHGEMSGGGVCMNCQHNTAGINCQQCRDGFYRPFNVPLDSPHVCRRTTLFYLINILYKHLIANISRTQQDIVSRKMALQTMIIICLLNS